jgi:putative intracellular protease/amidase
MNHRMHQFIRPVRKRIGFLGYDGIMALDLVGPMEAFANAPIGDFPDATVGGYEVVVIALDKRPFTSEAGLEMQPHYCLRDAPELGVEALEHLIEGTAVAQARRLEQRRDVRRVHSA